MLNNSDVKSLVVGNLSDPRISGIQFFINNLIERQKHGGGINQYRITQLTSDTNLVYITSLEKFILAIDAAKLIADCNYHADKATGNNTKSIVVYLTNLVVELDSKTDEDLLYISQFGAGNKKIALYLNYLNDADTVLPLKIYDIRLY